jgi:hypothetical protein
VRRDLGTAAQVLAVPTLALLVVVAFFPGRAELAIRIYALILAVAALALLLSALRRAFPSTTPLLPADGDRAAPPTPVSLARLENAVALGAAGAVDFQHRLHPRLNALARDLLASRRRISLDAEPDAAHRVLGDEAWELVRPDRAPPEDRQARGPELRAIRGVVDALEQM